MNTQKQVASLLTKTKKTLSVAESCTGGMLSNILTNIPGSSKFFRLGLIPYDNQFKTTLLKIPKKILKATGAVSGPTVLLMAKNIRSLAKTDFSLSISGIAGPPERHLVGRGPPERHLAGYSPGGKTEAKPVGLVYIGLSSQGKDICKKFIFKGNRLSVKKQAVNAALNLLLAQIKK